MSRVVRWKVNDLGQIKANLESLGDKLEIQNMCGITFEDKQNPGVFFTDGNPAVGEITAVLGEGLPPITIAVCEKCLTAVSEGVNNKMSLG